MRNTIAVLRSSFHIVNTDISFGNCMDSPRSRLKCCSLLIVPKLCVKEKSTSSRVLMRSFALLLLLTLVWRAWPHQIIRPLSGRMTIGFTKPPSLRILTIVQAVKESEKEGW